MINLFSIEAFSHYFLSNIMDHLLQLEKRTVDVMAGVTTGDLKTFQLQTKLNLNANVILDLVQMVSVVQTGCHVSFSKEVLLFILTADFFLTGA